jgi:hypothetical protein
MGGGGCLCRNGDQTRGTSGLESDAEERGECVPRVWQDCVICFDIEAVRCGQGCRLKQWAQLQLLDLHPGGEKKNGSPQHPTWTGLMPAATLGANVLGPLGQRRRGCDAEKGKALEGRACANPCPRALCIDKGREIGLRWPPATISQPGLRRQRVAICGVGYPGLALSSTSRLETEVRRLNQNGINNRGSILRSFTAGPACTTRPDCLDDGRRSMPATSDAAQKAVAFRALISLMPAPTVRSVPMCWFLRCTPELPLPSLASTFVPQSNDVIMIANTRAGASQETGVL